MGSEFVIWSIYNNYPNDGFSLNMRSSNGVKTVLPCANVWNNYINFINPRFSIGENVDYNIAAFVNGGSINLLF